MLSISTTAFASNESNETIANNYTEISLEELALTDGVSVVFTINSDNEVVYNNSNILTLDEEMQPRGIGRGL